MTSIEIQKPLAPRVTRAEYLLLSSLMYCAKGYLEFGSGGSTLLALERVKGFVHSVDSSREWLDAVRTEAGKSSKRLKTHFANIGKIGPWGRPLAKASKRFPTYSTSVWKKIIPAKIDVVFVDGRFRVACFCEAAARMENDTRIVIHDYYPRTHYNVIEEVATKIAVARNLVVFLPKPDKRERASELAEEYRNDPR